MDYRIGGNTAPVAASSSGLGRAAAESLAGEEVDVVINGRDEDRLKETAAEVQATAEGKVLGHRRISLTPTTSSASSSEPSTSSARSTIS